MIRFRRKIREIFNTIISLVSINMMDSFIWQEKPSKFLFHYQTMFSNIFLFCSIWMSRTVYIKVSSNIYSASFKSKSMAFFKFVSRIMMTTFLRSYHSFLNFFVHLNTFIPRDSFHEDIISYKPWTIKYEL